MTEYYYISVGISYLLLITAIILSIIKYKQTTKNEKWYIYYIIFVFCIELLSLVLPFIKIKNNAFLYQIYIAGEFFTVTGIFIKKLNLSKYSFVITGLLSLFFLTADRILGQYQYNNDYSKALTNIIMVILIGYSLIQDIKNIKNKSPFQVIDKTYFFYFTVSLFIFMLQHQLIEFPFEYFSTIWIINNLMVCVLYCLFIKTFLSLKK